MTLIAANLFPELNQRLFRKSIAGWLPLVGIGSFLLCEMAALTFLRWRLARDKDFPRPARFANALIETSLPGVIIAALSFHMDPHVVFGFWPPLLYFIFILLSTLRLDFWLSLWTGTVAAIQQMVLVLWLLPATTPATTPAVVDRLLATSSEPASEMRTVCVLFLDIRGFTATTRQRPAGETVALLNDFFAEMIEVVDRHGGIINKFLGDGFLALFGAPLKDPSAATNALAAARGMLDAVDAWNLVRPRQTLRIGIGIHIGEAVTGTVGSPQRKEYTVIGDTVNLAARLEQLTKETGSRLLVSSSVRDAMAASGDGGPATDPGPMAIRGYDEGGRVWRLA